MMTRSISLIRSNVKLPNRQSPTTQQSYKKSNSSDSVSGDTSILFCTADIFTDIYKMRSPLKLSHSPGIHPPADAGRMRLRFPPYSHIMALIGATNQQKTKIFQEINETNSKKCEEIKQIIEQWIKIQPHLPKNYDERIVNSFIRGCKHDVERIKRKLDHYFTYRTIMSEIFMDRDSTIEEMKRMRTYFVAFPLPTLTNSGCRVTWHKVMPDDQGSMNVKTIVRYLIMLGEVRLIEEGPISGDIVVFDLAQSKAAMVSKLLHPIIKKGVMCSQNAFPQRVKEVHVINAPSYMDTGVNIFKMFVKQKIKERFHVYSDSLEEFFKYVPRESLPSDYGGKEKSIEALQNEWFKKLESYRSYFEDQENVCTDESKRLNKPETSNTEYEDLFGRTGSFHKLSID